MDSFKPSFSWYNFTTGEYDQLSVPPTDEQARQFIPQDPSVQQLYTLYRQDMDVKHAMVKVLEKWLGGRVA
jgi:hypothetical protein